MLLTKLSVRSQNEYKSKIIYEYKPKLLFKVFASSVKYFEKS